MKSSEMIKAVAKKTRAYEKKLRAVEADLTQMHQREIALQQDVALKLQAIAGLQLEQRPDLDEEITNHLKLREQEHLHLQSSLRVVEGEISEALEIQEDIRRQISDEQANAYRRLASHKDYADLRDADAQAAENLALAKVNHEEIDSECDRKLGVFTENPLFQYLLSKGFGTEDYRRRGVIRAMDAWVAHACNFKANQEVFLTLQGMVEANKKALAPYILAAEKARTSLLALTNLMVDAKKSSKLDADLERQTKGVEVLKGRANQIHQLMARYAEKMDERYLKARNLVLERMKRETPEELLLRAKRTPDVADDAMVIEVGNLLNELKDVQKEEGQLTRQRSTAFAEYERAKSMERELRDSRYTSDRYEYPASFDINALMAGYMLGDLNKGAVLREVQQARTERPQESPVTWSSGSSGGGFSFSDSSSSSWSSSSSSSSSSSEFSTSDSF